MNSLRNSIEAALNDWRKSGVQLLPPAPYDQMIEALLATGRPISRDVIELYSLTGGMVDGESDPRLFNLWDLDRVIEENRKYRGMGLLFADFCIDAHCYAFNYESPERSSVAIEYFNQPVPDILATSVEEFFVRLLTDQIQ